MKNVVRHCSVITITTFDGALKLNGEQVLLNDRQLCLLSNSVLQLKELVEKMASQELTKEEFLEVLGLISDSNEAIMTEVEYGIDLIEVENGHAN